MVLLTLTPHQVDLLGGILGRATRDERVEARRTDSFEFKAALRRHLLTLDELHHRLAPTVELTEHEAAVLRELLRCELGDLRVEIRHTDTWSYKAGLRERAEDLRSILSALDTRVAVPT